MGMDDIAPVRVKDTRVYLSGSAGGFDVRDCPNPEVLAAKIGTALNAHDALVAALTDLASETRSACDARRFPSLTVALSEADAALALARANK